MPFSDTPYDIPTKCLMAAALETTWLAAAMSIHLELADRVRMKLGILDAVTRGERDLKHLQCCALHSIGAAACPSATDAAPVASETSAPATT